MIGFIAVAQAGVLSYGVHEPITQYSSIPASTVIHSAPTVEVRSAPVVSYPETVVSHQVPAAVELVRSAPAYVPSVYSTGYGYAPSIVRSAPVGLVRSLPSGKKLLRTFWVSHFSKNNFFFSQSTSTESHQSTSTESLHQSWFDRPQLLTPSKLLPPPLSPPLFPVKPSTQPSTVVPSMKLPFPDTSCPRPHWTWPQLPKSHTLLFVSPSIVFDKKKEEYRKF